MKFEVVCEGLWRAIKVFLGEKALIHGIYLKEGIQRETGKGIRKERTVNQTKASNIE